MTLAAGSWSVVFPQSHPFPFSAHCVNSPAEGSECVKTGGTLIALGAYTVVQLHQDYIKQN